MGEFHVANLSCRFEGHRKQTKKKPKTGRHRLRTASAHAQKKRKVGDDDIDMSLSLRELKRYYQNIALDA